MLLTITLFAACLTLGMWIGYRSAHVEARRHAQRRHPSYVTDQIDALPEWPADPVIVQLDAWRAAQ